MWCSNLVIKKQSYKYVCVRVGVRGAGAILQDTGILF